MKKTMTLALCLLSPLSFADSATNRSAWYLMAELGSAKSDTSKADLNAVLSGRGVNAQVSELDNKDTAWGLHLGYRLHPHLALELGYMDLGKREAKVTGRHGDTQAFYDAVSDLYPVTGDGVSIALASAWSLWQEQFTVTARLGYLDWSGDYVSDDVSTRVGQGQLSGGDIWFGAGVSYRLSQHWSASANVKQVKLEQDKNTAYSLGLTYHF